MSAETLIEHNRMTAFINRTVRRLSTAHKARTFLF